MTTYQVYRPGAEEFRSTKGNPWIEIPEANGARVRLRESAVVDEAFVTVDDETGELEFDPEMVEVAKEN